MTTIFSEYGNVNFEVFKQKVFMFWNDSVFLNWEPYLVALAVFAKTILETSAAGINMAKTAITNVIIIANAAKNAAAIPHPTKGIHKTANADARSPIPKSTNKTNTNTTKNKNFERTRTKIEPYFVKLHGFKKKV